MTGLEDVVYHVDSLTLPFNASSLSTPDRVDCIIMYNRLNSTIDLENPDYKTMSDLLKESISAIIEMRYDVERIVGRSYSLVPIVEGILFSEAMVELSKEVIDSYESCVSYLSELCILSNAVLRRSHTLELEQQVFFNTLLCICINGINLFRYTKELPPLREGVVISFDSRRRRRQGIEV